MNKLLWRAGFAFLVLPGMIAFIVPWWLVSSRAAQPGFNPWSLPLLGVGIFLLFWCVRDFYVAGKGTLAPWSPPRHLVTVGLYRYSRNPMYVAVLLILSGWAIGFRSALLAMYTFAVAIAFHLRVILHEEPWLKRQFGASWLRYKSKVPRWIGPIQKETQSQAGK